MRTHGKHRHHGKIDWDELKYTIRCDWQEYLRATAIIGGCVGLVFLFIWLLAIVFVQGDVLNPDDVRNWLDHLWNGDR